jgi:hypothetical protein
MRISCSISRDHGHKVNETNQDAQANSGFAKLLDYALCYAIRSVCDDSVVNPPDSEDSTHGLPNVEKKNGRLAGKLNELN